MSPKLVPLIFFIIMFSAFLRVDALSASLPSLEKTWTPNGNAAAGGEDLAVDSSRNITIAGLVTYPDLGDALLLRYNASGSLLFQKAWGGSGYDDASGVAVDSAGNAYLTGRTSSFGNGHFRIFLVKFDSAGNLLWQETWAGSDTAENGGAAMDSLGGILVTGLTFNLTSSGVTPNPPSDGVLLKFNSTGSVLWQVVWSGSGGTFGRVLTDLSGDIYTVSSTSLLKFNSTGGLVWARTWSGMTGGDISQDATGDIYLTGIGSSTIYLLKISQDGGLLWQERWQSSGWMMGDEGVAANATGIVYVTADMSTQVPLYRGYATYHEPLILEFNSTGSLLGELAIQGYGIGGLGRPSTDSAGSLYLVGAGEVAGAIFCSPAGGLTTFPVSFTAATGQVLRPSYSVMPASGTVNTPSGNETSQGGVILMKLDPPISGGSVTCSSPLSVFPLALPVITVMGVTIILQARRRLNRSLKTET